MAVVQCVECRATTPVVDGKYGYHTTLTDQRPCDMVGKPVGGSHHRQHTPTKHTKKAPPKKHSS